MQEQTNIEDWRNEITPSKATLKVLDGQTVFVTFKNEGVKKESKDYGNSIAFNVLVDKETEEKTFYVKMNNYDLLGQIKELGNLNGLHVKIGRVGSKKSDTRYKIEKA